MNSRVRELFHELADRTTEERVRYFAEHVVDEEIRHEVELLLACDSGSTASLHRAIGDAARRSVPQLEANPPRCGPYRLLNVIGRGGMGVVYLAERDDGEVSQRLAVKLLPPGAGDPLHERFLQERQILASLAHPNIARMLDAGHLENGQPFLAMEYVEGRPIDAFAAGLSARQKVSLFLKVCHAVAYLHRNLVVHRDLKPGNILVTPDGEPKLLDFGIAKILDLSTDRTITSLRALTPDYASPEQISGAKISTASDIYSLGAVLYQLLTGKPAHEFGDRSAEAMTSAILTREPTRPSKWVPELKGDLEPVLLKALRNDPHERYSTVDQFAEDLEAFLESRPVRARSGDKWYRAQKFFRRHWIPVGALVLVVGSLSAGLYIANRERLAADRERSTAQRRFDQLRQLSNRVFALDAAIRELPGSTQARQTLVTASLAYLEGLAADAGSDLALAQEVGEGYWRVGRILGVPTDLNLGQSAPAEANLQKADRLMDLVLASEPQNRRALKDSEGIIESRMILADSDHRTADALAHAHKAADRLNRFLALGHLQETDVRQATGAANNIALGFLNQHQYADAVALVRRTLNLPQSGNSVAPAHAASFSLLANALRYQGDLEGALQAIRQALKVTDEAVYRNATSRMLDQYGVVLREGLILGEDGGINLNRPEEAIAAFQSAIDVTEAIASKDSNDAVSRGRVGTSTRELGNILRWRDPRRALAAYDLGIRRLGEIPNNLKARRDRALNLAASSYALRRLHRNAEARQRIADAIAVLKETKDYSAERVGLESEVYSVQSALADQMAETGDVRGAIAVYEDLLRRVTAGHPPVFTDLRYAPKLSFIYQAMAPLYRRSGDGAKAKAIDDQRRELWRSWDGKLPGNSFVLQELAAVPQ